MTRDIKIDSFIRASIYSNIILITSMVYGLLPSLLAFLLIVIYVGIIDYQYLIAIQLIFVTLLITLRLTLINEKALKNTRLNKIMVVFIINIFSLMMIIINYKTFNLTFSGYMIFLITLPISSIAALLFVDNQIKTVKEIDIVKDEYELLKHSLNSTQAIQVIILDKEYNYLEANDIHKYIMKKFYNADIKKGGSYLEYYYEQKTKDDIKSKINLAFQGKQEEHTYSVPNGQVLKTFFSGIKNDQNEIESVVLFTQDITINKKKEEEVYELTYHDSLTNVYNRHYFMDNLDSFSEIEDLILIYIDVNMLKIINDAFGHYYGDLLLETVASEALKHFGVNSTVIRMGGDELIIILEDISESQAKSLLDEFVEKNQKNIIIAVPISISVGLAVKENNKSFEQVFREAEEKMYNNKLFTYEARRESLVENINNHLIKENIIDLELIEIKKIYGKKILKKLNLESEESLLNAIINNYQIGKISIERDILDNNQRSHIEKKLYVTYIDLSYRILASIPKYREVSDIVATIEENYDGSGYPNGLRENEIPILSQILNLLNYSSKYLESNHQQLIKDLKQLEEKRFNQELLKSFIDILEDEKES